MLVVTDEASAFHDPGEGALDDPTATQDDETGHERKAADDLDCDGGLLLRPVHQLSGISTIGEDGLDERDAATRLLQNGLATFAVLDVGTMDLAGQQPAIRVGQDRAFAPMDAFSGIVSFDSPL